MHNSHNSNFEGEIFYMDSKTPFKVHLTAYYKRSFAFHTIKERLPVILTKLIDYLVRDRDKIIKTYGETAREELKAVIGEISKLKYEIQTNKPIPKLDSQEPDAKIYNQYLLEQSKTEGNVRFFTAIWLHAECFMYRTIRYFFENTSSLKKFDYFEKQKQDAFNQNICAIKSLAEYILPLLTNSQGVDVKQEFIKLLKLNLWGNRCDLSITAGEDSTVSSDPILFINKYESCILSDHSSQIWDILQENSAISGPKLIDFINDNAGYEMFTDFCLADFLITYKFCDKICFNIKSMPWFISDTNPNDFEWIIQTLINHENKCLKTLGFRWKKYIDDQIWSYKTDLFWTLPFDFTKMQSQSPELYNRLSKSILLIFKGDLNYRKLFGEIYWEPSTAVVDALQGFQPTKLCTLRTVKADIICGLRKGLAEEIDKKEPDWMTTGNYGVIQFAG